MKITLHKKTLILLTIIFICCGGASSLFYFTNKKDIQQTTYIAIPGPLKSANGRDMFRGITLAFQSMHEQGKLKNIKIELIPYNEKNNKDALENASRIADENKALAVIGHYTNAGTLAAGAIYRDNGIPALTASAADEKVTQGNEWYFKIMPDRRSTRVLLAYTVKNLLLRNTVSIIFDKNNYGSNLVQSFEKQAEKAGIQIKNKWFFDSGDEDSEHQIRGIVGRLRATQNPGTIFCALYANDADNIFTELRYPGTDFQIIGPNSFSTPSFISQFNEYPKENETPGYYTDGTYAVSPFISYLADSPLASDFRKKNIDRYGTEPSWVTANYYDAALLIANAIERAEIKGKDIMEDRRKLKKALKSFNEPDNAVQGITGKLYFDQERTVPRSLQLGVWKQHQFLPAYFQYQETATENDSKVVTGKQEITQQNVSKDKENTGNQLEFNGQQLDRYRVVYTGIDINHISNIDIKQGQFTADFYIWFRYMGDFDDTDIIFPDALTPIVLGKPFSSKKTHDGAHLRIYKKQADFITSLNLQPYPLDHHKLRIRFHHSKETRNQLIYVPDVEGLPFLSRKNDQGQSMVRTIPGWKVKDISYSQLLKASPGNSKVPYSVFSTDVEIQRHDRLCLLAKNFSPVFFIILAWYFVFFHPKSRGIFRFHALLLAVLLTLWIHVVYAPSLPGQSIIKNISFVLYLAIGAGGLTSGTMYLFRLSQKNSDQTDRYLLCAGQVMYCVVTLGGIFFVLYHVQSLLHS
ncbi:MAG: ABC transporter substrate-binding protein [Candidatus Electrothrix aestuarii]|uniref:ABC transporter substrate-binding protein n=1 Tax=Candidatus Electrothrix aestuarii TaxID=3062594 RepID=A0AAU8LYW4_9BACT